MKARISKTVVDAARPGDGDLFIWDDAFPGFGLKVTPKGQKIYVYQYRLDGRLHRFRIGRHGVDVLSPDLARDQAFIAKGEVKKGNHPGQRDGRPIETVAELAERYMVEYAGRHKKASSVRQDRRNLNNHVLPLLGTLRVAAIDKDQVMRALDAVASGKTAKDEKTVKQGRRRVTGGEIVANRVHALLHTMFARAEDWKLRPAGSNPCVGIKRYRENKVERFLSRAEFGRLGAVLGAATRGELRVHGDVPEPEKRKRGGQMKVTRALPASAISAIRLLLYTGCRPGEITGLAWTNVDLDRGLLSIDGKTGRRAVFLAAPAIDVLKSVPRQDGQRFVFPAAPDHRPARDGKPAPAAPIASLRRPWELLCKAAGITDLRLHDLRHSFASVGAAEGYSLPMIGSLLGHSNPATTSRYAHLKAAPQQEAADAISRRIADLMTGEG